MRGIKKSLTILFGFTMGKILFVLNLIEIVIVYT